MTRYSVIDYKRCLFQVKLKRPIARFYLFGYGVSLMLVAVSGAIDVRNYTTSSQCFLKMAPFLGALVVPASLVCLLLIGKILSV